MKCNCDVNLLLEQQKWYMKWGAANGFVFCEQHKVYRMISWAEEADNLAIEKGKYIWNGLPDPAPSPAGFTPSEDDSEAVKEGDA